MKDRGPRHYELAERALEHSRATGLAPGDAKLWLAAASVHASLARTAALISVETADFDAWRAIFAAAADEEIAEHQADVGPLVECGHEGPNGLTCVRPVGHFDGWPEIDCQHARFVPELDEVVRWRDPEHPDPDKLCMIPGETTCGSWIGGRRCVLMPGHDGECVPYGPVGVPSEPLPACARCGRSAASHGISVGACESWRSAAGMAMDAPSEPATGPMPVRVPGASLAAPASLADGDLGAVRS